MNNTHTSPSSRWCERQFANMNGTHNVKALLSFYWIPAVDICFANREEDKRQKGNALFFILVAIGLLGLLTVMLSRSGSSTTETGDYEQNVIVANEILSYAKNIENAVQGLLARGCSENELSFWHDSNGDGVEDASDDYFNTVSDRADRSCHVFDVAGAGLNWDGFGDTEEVRITHISGRTEIQGVGRDCNNTRCSELALIFFMADGNDAQLCAQLNRTLTHDDLSPPPSTLLMAHNNFQGSYTPHFYNASIIPELIGKHTACYNYATDTNEHIFYHVLHAR